MSRRIEELALTGDQVAAIREVRGALERLAPVESVAVFGSAARGEADEDSDLDLLVLTRGRVSPQTRVLMSDAVFDINWKYGTNISIVVVDAASWQEGVMRHTPLYAEVQKDGVFL